PQRAASTAREDSALTHPNPVCIDACAAYAAAIAAGIAGASPDAMREAALAQASKTHAASAARAAIERGAAGELPADFESGAGAVLTALQNAFYQLFHAPGVEEGIIATVHLGADTDTNAAIAGALLGAAHGKGAFPSRWVLPLLACRPLAGAGAPRPRAYAYWPDDALDLAEALVKDAM
ncbi:MAG: ADP-ribosylglycohydrolase family protein, partial [Betaproteobacteria bacterium]|nr:ADP-ribosylglycohydrolase family protein [Betaproteobacteria bacterium]